MQLPPMSVVASWPKANYTNPATRGPTNVIVSSSLLGFVTIVMVIRLYTRHWISNGLCLDDLLIVMAWIPATAFAIVGILGAYKYELERHVWDIEPENVVPGIKVGLTNQVLFAIATTLTKLSILALIYRATAAGKSRTRYVVLILSLIIALDGLIFVIVLIFQCRPVSDYWTLSVTPQQCINETAHLLAAGIINTVTDFVVVLVPIRTVISLDLPRQQRIIVAVLFAAGFFASGAGAVRTYVTWLMTTAADHDVSWRASLTFLASAIELYVGILCASIPATRPFFSRYLPRLLSVSPVSVSRISRHMKLGSDKALAAKSPPPMMTLAVRQYAPYLSPRTDGGRRKSMSFTALPHAGPASAIMSPGRDGAGSVKQLMSPIQHAGLQQHNQQARHDRQPYQQHQRNPSNDAQRRALTYNDLNKPLPKVRTMDRLAFLALRESASSSASGLERGERESNMSTIHLALDIRGDYR